MRIRGYRVIALTLAAVLVAGAVLYARGLKGPTLALANSVEVANDLVTSPGHSLSPNQEYVAAAKNSGNSVGVTFVPLNGSAAQVELVALSAPESSGANQQNQLSLVAFPVAWLDNDACLIAVSGDFTVGSHSGKRGISLWKASPGKRSIEEIGFQECEGYYGEAIYLSEKGKVYFNMLTCLLEYDLGAGTFKTLVSDIVSPHTFFTGRISPDGKYFAYETQSQDKSGVFVFNISKGEEVKLEFEKGTRGFYPYWSPDGSMLSAYFVNMKPNIPEVSSETWEMYDYLATEEGPASAGAGVTFFRPSGEKIGSLSMQDVYVAHLAWSQDSKTIAFVTIPKQEATQGQIVPGDALWYTSPNSTATPRKLADNPAVSGQRAWIFPVCGDITNRGFYYRLSDGSNESLMYAAKSSSKSVKLTEGMTVVETGVAEPAYKKPVYNEGLLMLQSDGSKTRVGLLVQGKLTYFAEFGTPFAVQMAAFGKDKLVLVEYPMDISGKSKFHVYTATR